MDWSILVTNATSKPAQQTVSNNTRPKVHVHTQDCSVVTNVGVNTRTRKPWRDIRRFARPMYLVGEFKIELEDSR